LFRSRRRRAPARRERLLKPTLGQQPRAFGQPNDWLPRQRLWVQRWNARREQQAQAERQPNDGRDDAEGDGGAADALPSAARPVDEYGSAALHGRDTNDSEGLGDRD